MNFSPSLPCILHTATKSSERRCEFCLFISVISIIVLAIYYHRFFLTKYQRDTAQKSNYGYSSPPVSPQAREAAWCSTQEPKMPRVITSCYTHKQTVTELTLQLWSWSISSSASNLQYWLNRNSSVPEHRCFCTLSNFHHSMKAAFSFLDGEIWQWNLPTLATHGDSKKSYLHLPYITYRSLTISLIYAEAVKDSSAQAQCRHVKHILSVTERTIHS